MAVSKETRRLKIRRKIRKKVFGISSKPRLSVFRSNTNIFSQLIDDNTGITLVCYSSLNFDDELAKKKMTKIEQAKLVGKLLAERAIAKGIKEVVFDRNGYLYHGRVKQLADAAREGGLKF